MNKFKKILNQKTWIVLVLIIFFAGFIRVYQITESPPSLSWDEAAVGYNSWTLATYGRDERGNLFPAYFTSFLDDKHPIHIYLTAFFVKILGLSEFSIRFSSAFFGILNVLLIFFLARTIFKNSVVGLMAAFLMTISPYAIHFSRFNHELNFTLFFFLLSLYLFFKGKERKSILLSLAFLTFGITFISYHSAKIIVPLVVIFLVALFFRDLKKQKTNLIIGLSFLLIFGAIIVFNPPLLGTSRAKQTAISDDLAKNTFLYAETGNLNFGKINLIVNNYLSHFSYDYLFLKGDRNPRLSSQVSGQFYLIELPFLILGVLFILLGRKKGVFVVLFIALISPLAASFSTEVPHAARSMFVVGSWQIVEAYGIYKFVALLKFKWIKVFIYSILVFFFLFLFKEYTYNYYTEYSKRYAIDWQFGMKQIVEFVKLHPEYTQVYMTKVRSQPYIFFLMYTKKPLDDYLSEVEYNNSESRSYNLVSGFDKYLFEYWDPIEIKPIKGNLYVLAPDQYDGLRYKNEFKIKKIVYYPNRTTAFYLVSKN